MIDTRRNLLNSSAPEAVRTSLIGELREAFGARDFEAKLARFREVSPPWARLVWPHLNPEREVYDAYTLGAFYPALTAACCMAEAVLNVLVVRVREHFKESPSYKKVYRKDSFQDWSQAIDVLLEWGVFNEEMAARFNRLNCLRNEAVHPRTLQGVQGKAREALGLYSEVVHKLFGPREDLIFWCPGEMYIRREKEADPLVKELFIPACKYVGYKHSIDENWNFVDPYDYEDRVVDDQEFRRLREKWRAREASE